MPVSIKRAYEKPARNDGVRVLVDRLWPRGVKKETARIDEWLKDIAPSDELRKWYHASDDWVGFKKRYYKELGSPEGSAALMGLYDLIDRSRQVTLVYSSSNTERNNAVALKELVDGIRKPPSSSGPAKAAAVPSRMAKRRPNFR
ncbi:MAG TPA: DUF488 family protein [Candidatus Angelobacter sp.]|jgi:uncharacterized protein YeaO (DUF488 family)|nr:DUF488 family protein [Candidatus Angelobacter sp.]